MLLLLSFLFASSVSAAEDPCAAPRPELFEGRRPSDSDAERKIGEACTAWSPNATGSVEFLADGTISSAFCSVGDKRAGPIARWHESGKLAAIGNMGPEGLCGKWSRYFENGELRDEGMWKDGEPVGKWQTRKDPAEELSEREFKPQAKPGSEWSLLVGILLQVHVEDNAARKIQVAYGPTLSGRWGHRLIGPVQIEFRLFSFRTMRTPLGTTNTREIDTIVLFPFPSVGFFYKFETIPLRLGIWGGVAPILDIHLNNVPRGPIGIAPLPFLSAQYRTPLMGGKFGKNVILELDVTPTLPVLVAEFIVVGKTGIEF